MLKENNMYIGQGVPSRMLSHFHLSQQNLCAGKGISKAFAEGIGVKCFFFFSTHYTVKCNQGVSCTNGVQFSRKMTDEETWKIFFKENPKPANFEEHVSKLKDLIQQAVTKKNRLVPVTVSCCLFLSF